MRRPNGAAAGTVLVEIVTDRAPICPRVVDEVAPAARDVTKL
jgi:hypothetical protein